MSCAEFCGVGPSNKAIKSFLKVPEVSLFTSASKSLLNFALILSLICLKIAGGLEE